MSYQQAADRRLRSQRKGKRKRERPPAPPLREKGKGKEDKPGASSTGLFARADAHVRGALLRRHVNAAVEDALAAFCGTRGPAPSDEALARQSHLHRVTVIRCLDALKRKGYLKWISGGRKKRGRVLSNLYKLTLPKPAPKRNETVLSEFWEDVDNSHSRVSHCDGYPSHSETPHSLMVRPLPVSQRDSIIYRSSKENPDGHNPPQEAADVEMPGRFAFGVARRDGTPLDLEWWSSGAAADLQNAAVERAYAPYRKQNAP